MNETLLVLPAWLALSVDDAVQLGGAIWMVWAIAWGLRTLRHLVPVVGKADED